MESELRGRERQLYPLGDRVIYPHLLFFFFCSTCLCRYLFLSLSLFLFHSHFSTSFNSVVKKIHHKHSFIQSLIHTITPSYNHPFIQSPIHTITHSCFRVIWWKLFINRILPSFRHSFSIISLYLNPVFQCWNGFIWRLIVICSLSLSSNWSPCLLNVMSFVDNVVSQECVSCHPWTIQWSSGLSFSLLMREQYL